MWVTRVTEGMNEWAQYVSLCLTLPTIVLSLLVVARYGPRGWRAVKAMRRRKPTEVELLITGISVGFIGSVVDNLYWGLAWGSDFLNLDVRDTLFDMGVWSNIPFRQVTGSIAAVLHLWAAQMIVSRRRMTWRLVALFVTWGWVLVWLHGRYGR